MKPSKIWKESKKAPAAFVKKLSGDYPDGIIQLFFNRGLDDKKAIDKFFNPTYESSVHDPRKLRQIKKACNRIKKASDNKEKVGIFSDYDADGITSATMMFEFLSHLKLKPDVYFPDRDKEGYGLNTTAIDHFAQQGITLMFVLDCGTTNIDEIAYANEKGINVIVMDHHLVPEKIPAAYALINPHHPDDKYPFNHLSAGGVVFKSIQAFSLFYPDLFKPGTEKRLLDLVAISTVADQMPLFNENRALVMFGFVMMALRKRVGIAALFEAARLTFPEHLNNTTVKNMNAQTIAFSLGPRLNAASRMEHAAIGFELLTTKDKSVARKNASILEKSNSGRRNIQQKIVKQILKNYEDKDPKWLVAQKNPDWSVGMLGLCASNIMEKFYTPTLVCHDRGELTKCSGRTIPEINLVKHFKKCKKYLTQFGGHAMAAGLSMETKNFGKFTKAFEAEIKKTLKNKKPLRSISLEVTVPAQDVNLELGESIASFGPFGKDNPLPLVRINNLKLASHRLIGKTSRHLKIAFHDAKGESDTPLSAVFFENGHRFHEFLTGEVYDVACELMIDEWRGRKQLTLKIIDIQSTC